MEIQNEWKSRNTDLGISNWNIPFIFVPILNSVKISPSTSVKIRTLYIINNFTHLKILDVSSISCIIRLNFLILHPALCCFAVSLWIFTLGYWNSHEYSIICVLNNVMSMRARLNIFSWQNVLITQRKL